MQLLPRKPDVSREIFAGAANVFSVIRSSDAASARVLPVLIAVGAPSLSTASQRRPTPSIGVFLNLLSLAVVAVATIGVFFGIALSLLRQPANTLVVERSPSGRGDDVGRSPQSGLPTAASGDPNIAPTAAKPPPPLRSRPAPIMPRPAPVVAAPLPKAAARMPINANAAAPAAPRLPAQQLAELLARGDAFLRAGDIASARLFYERAADDGDAQAALRVGATFDPTFLASVGLRNMRGDPAEALFWYHRAVGLGARNAQPYLNSIETK